jgi:hypothetical protein
MSLAPAERRALDAIGDSLRRSDPRLARMLTHFAVPLSRGALAILAYRLWQRRLLVMVILAVVSIAVIVVAALHSPDPPVPCGTISGTGFSVPSTQGGSCPP